MDHATGSYDFIVVGAGTAECVLAALPERRFSGSEQHHGSGRLHDRASSGDRLGDAPAAPIGPASESTTNPATMEIIARDIARAWSRNVQAASLLTFPHRVIRAPMNILP